MKSIISLLVLCAIFATSAAYADGFHVQNHAHTNLLATVYFDGKLETTRTLQPGQEYTHSFWHNLAVTVTLFNPKTQQSCSLEVSERCYSPHYFGTGCTYEPFVGAENGEGCPYFSSFPQVNWQTKGGLTQNYSYVDIWTPWP